MGDAAAVARNRLAPLAAPAVAIAGGVVWGLQFGRDPYLLAPWVALAPLVLLLGHPRAGGLGLLHGLAAWLVAIPWIAATLADYGELPVALSWALLGLLALYLAAYHALFARLGAPVWRRSPWLALVGLPALWVGLEWVRGWLLTGFSWNLAAFAWVEVPGALPLAAWVGAYGVSFLVVLAATGLAATVARRRWEPAAVGLLVPLLLLAAGGRWGAGEPAGATSVPVRVVQPNTPILDGGEPGTVQREYEKTFRLSRQACERPGALVVWPESAAWPFSLDRHPGFRQGLEELARDAGCPLLVGSTTELPGRLYNSVYLVDGAGVGPRYDKRHLVPFGEYVPLGGIFPFVDRLARAAGDFTAAEEARLLEWRDQAIGTAICFEILFPGHLAELARDGATLLVTVTNDAWFGDSSAPYQHFRAARFRAAETRRSVVRAAITGVSGLIRTDGSVEQRLGVGEEGVLVGEVVARRDVSPHSRAPWAVPLASVLGAAFAIVAGRRSVRP